MGVGNVGSVGAGVSSSRSTGSNTKEQPATKNTASSATVKAASPTTAVRNDTRDTSTPARVNTPAETGGKNTGLGGIAAAANVGGGVSSAGGGNKNTGNGGQTADRVDQDAPAWLQLQDQLDALSPVATHIYGNGSPAEWDAAHGGGTAAVPAGLTPAQRQAMSQVPYKQFFDWQAAHGHGSNINLNTDMMPEDPQGFVDFERALSNFGALNWKGRPESDNIEDRRPPSGILTAAGTPLSEPGMETSWADFDKNVTNGSMGMPGASGYGLDHNPDAPQPNILQTGLKAAHDFLQAPYNARVAANGGVAPFEGPIDTAGIVHALNAPYYRRMLNEGSDAAGGALPTPVTREVQTIPIHATTAEAKTNDWPNAWARLLDSSDRLPSDPLNTSAVAPAYTGGSEAIGRTLNPDGSYSEPLEAIQAATADVPMPRIDPRTGAPIVIHGGNDADSHAGEPGLVTGTRGGPTSAPSTWDKVVENGGKLLSHTGLGSIVSTLFPDLWNGMGENIKSLDNGAAGGFGSAQTKYPEDMATALAGMYGDPHSGHGNNGGGDVVAQAALEAAFPDVNHNGIDDRLEGLGGTSPPDLGGNQFRSNRQAVFPDMPPYRPGVDDEWNYFHDHLARGGVVGYADRDPRVSMIADAEDALHRGDHGHPSLDKFVDTFGPKALENLNTNVLAGHRMRAGMPGRTVVGPGGPTDDAVPAVIDGRHPAKLSSGEFVLPVAAVEGIGGGDPKVGADRLHDLVERFAK